MKFKRLLSLASVATMLMGSVAFADIPANTVVLGNKAYNVNLLFENDFITEIQAAANEANGSLFYNLGGGWKNIFSGTDVTDFSEWPQITYTPASGETMQYEAGNGEAIIEYVAYATVNVSEALPSFKLIKIEEINFPDAYQFQIGDTIGNIGDEIVITTPDNFVTVYLLDNAGEVVGTGTISVAYDYSQEFKITLP